MRRSRCARKSLAVAHTTVSIAPQFGDVAVGSVEHGLSVSELIERARHAAEATGWLVVQGELLDWKRAASGHHYGALGDGYSQVAVVMYAGAARRLPMEPQRGQQVLALGRLSVYAPFGRLQFVLKDLRPLDAAGTNARAREQLAARLRLEGLLDPSRKRPIPRFPRVVGIVTSPDSAALRDILAGLERRALWVKVVVTATTIEGPGAAGSVACAIRSLATSERIDLLIVARGGGDPSALAVFDTEPVVRAVAECSVPVITAIGHELHFTLADAVADLRAATPSAAAELAVPDKASIRRELSDSAGFLLAFMDRQLEARTHELNRISDRLVPALLRYFQHSQERLEAKSHRRLATALISLLRLSRERRARTAGERVATSMLHFLDRQRRDIGNASLQLDALSPLRVLGRGYAVAFDRTGVSIQSVRGVRPGDHITVMLADGSIHTHIVSITQGLEAEDGQLARDGIRGPPGGDRNDRSSLRAW